MHVWERLAQRLPDPLFVIRVHEGEEEAYGNRLDIGLADGRDGLVQALFVEGFDLAFGSHSLSNREAQVSGDEGGWTVLRQVVEGGAVLAGYLQHVLETLRGHERRAGPVAFQERVRRHRHTVGEGGEGCGLYIRGVDGVHHAL